MVLGIKSKKDASVNAKLIRAFDALGDATRFKLVKLLEKHDDICVSEIASEVGISTAGASQHLKILEQAGLVDRKRQGQKICYRINRENNENKRLIDMVLGRK